VFKSKALFVVAILVIAVAVIATSCGAPATPPATTTPPPATTTPPPATTTPPPATTTPPPAGAPVTHSWGDSATYTNDAVGFTVQYPAKWKQVTTGLDPTTVFKAAVDPSNTTGDAIYVDVEPAVTDLSTVAASLLNASAAFQTYKVTAKTTSTAPFTLTGSVTTATASVNTAKIVIYNFYFYAISATKGDKTVNVMGGTIGGGNAQKQIQEICQSLSFK
jgi:hypothetical protein